MAGKFEPKTAVTLDPPKDDIISKEELAKANGTTSPPQDAQQGMGICVNNPMPVSCIGKNITN
jgi:hypothetical protein